MDDRPTIPIRAITESDLRLLRIFRVVAESGGLTAAETRLGMERSTISRHIQSLEHRLRARLCHRGPNGFQLTSFGEAALRAARTAGDTLNAVRDELNAARSLLTGEVLIGLADNCLTNPEARIAQAVATFQRRAPDASLNLSIRPPSCLTEELMLRRMHMVVTGSPLRDDRFDSQLLFGEEFRLYRRAGGPDIGFEDVTAGRAALVTRACDPQSQALARYLDAPRRTTASGLEAVATLVASGGHLGFLPTHYVAQLAPVWALEEVPGAVTFAYRVSFSIVTERGRDLPAAASLFRSLLLDSHAERAREGVAVPAPV
jgi:DNA-binding transcriptional LysR family regulator